MNANFEPSPDFVNRVMRRVRSCEPRPVAPIQRLVLSRPLRYLLAGGGTLFGILRALPAF